MPDNYESDEDYQDEVYYVYKNERSTRGCICRAKYECRCRVMILPMED